jgi:hypothetical protein
VEAPVTVSSGTQLYERLLGGTRDMGSRATWEDRGVAVLGAENVPAEPPPRSFVIGFPVLGSCSSTGHTKGLGTSMNARIYTLRADKAELLGEVDESTIDYDEDDDGSGHGTIGGAGFDLVSPVLRASKKGFGNERLDIWFDDGKVLRECWVTHWLEGTPPIKFSFMTVKPAGWKDPRGIPLGQA